MTTTKKRTKLTKMLAIFLIMAISVACFSVTAFAEALYQCKNVSTMITTYGDSFNMGSNNRLTVSAMAVNLAGNPTTVHVYVQKNTSWGWSTIEDKYILVGASDPTTICRDAVVPSNTYCRVVLQVEGTTGTDIATVHIGIGMWQHS